MTYRLCLSFAACDPSPLVGEGSGAPSRSDGTAPREGGRLLYAAKLLTPLRERHALACSPKRGERVVC
jgi:hypothetical protein